MRFILNRKSEFIIYTILGELIYSREFNWK